MFHKGKALEISWVNLVCREELIPLARSLPTRLKAADKLHSTFQLKRAEIRPVYTVSENKTLSSAGSLARFDIAVIYIF